MRRWIVTLRTREGTRDVPVQARDEWEARQVALRRNASAGGRGAWCHDCREDHS